MIAGTSQRLGNGILKRSQLHAPSPLSKQAAPSESRQSSALQGSVAPGLDQASAAELQHAAALLEHLPEGDALDLDGPGPASAFRLPVHESYKDGADASLDSGLPLGDLHSALERLRLAGQAGTSPSAAFGPGSAGDAATESPVSSCASLSADVADSGRLDSARGSAAPGEALHTMRGSHHSLASVFSPSNSQHGSPESWADAGAAAPEHPAQCSLDGPLHIHSGLPSQTPLIEEDHAHEVQPCSLCIGPITKS